MLSRGELDDMRFVCVVFLFPYFLLFFNAFDVFFVDFFVFCVYRKKSRRKKKEEEGIFLSFFLLFKENNESFNILKMIILKLENK